MALECPLHSNSPGEVSTDFESPLRIEPIPELDERAAGDTEEADGVGADTEGMGLRLVEPFSVAMRVDGASFGTVVVLLKVATDFLSTKNHSACGYVQLSCDITRSYSKKGRTNENQHKTT